MGLTVSDLINDCDAYGLPVILVQHHGFILKIEPDDFGINEFDAVFWLNDEPVCRVSRLGDVELIKKNRPDNYLVKCKKCYSLIQTETGKCLCEFFWRED